ncbi:MAG: tetratricopeptide repeat protein [Kofleriaceae bacterium]
MKLQGFLVVLLTMGGVGAAQAGSKLRPEHLEPMRVELVETLIPAKPVPAPAPATVEKPRVAKINVADLYARGTKLYLSGDFTEAAASFKRAIAADRNYAPAHRGLGYVYQRMGMSSAAIDELERYLKLAPEATDATAVQRRIDRMGGN